MINHRKIITLCGSTKFKDGFERENERLTLEGSLSISVGVFQAPEEQKALLDEIHLRKIDLADAIHVINKGGYINPDRSTAKEIQYAIDHGKEVTYMEPVSSSPEMQQRPKP